MCENKINCIEAQGETLATATVDTICDECVADVYCARVERAMCRALVKKYAIREVPLDMTA